MAEAAAKTSDRTCSARTCSCAWPRCSRPSSATCRAPRRRPGAVLELRRRGRRRAGLPRSHLRQDRATSRSWPSILRRRIAITDDPTSSSSCTSASARSLPTSSTTPTQRWPATWPCSSTNRARPRRSRPSSASTSAPSAGKSCSASTRRCSTSRRATRPCPTATRAWPRSPRDVLGQRDKRGRAVAAASSICAAPTRMALSALADLHEQAEEWRELTEVLDSQIARHRGARGPHSRLQAPRPRVGREARARAQRARMLAEGRSRSIRGDVEALRAIADNYRSAGAWEELADILRTTISVGTPAAERATRSRSSTRSWASSRAPPSCASTPRSRPGAQVLQIDPRDFRALAALENPVHAGGALGGVRGRARAARPQVLDARRARSTC